MIVIGMFDYYSAAPVKQTDLSYTKFLQQVDADKIKQLPPLFENEVANN